MTRRHSILSIVDPKEEHNSILQKFVDDCGCDIIEESELDISLERVQQRKFDVILLDAEMQGMQIDRFIHILKELDPAVKIIVVANQNSKDLEAKIRKAKVYYYHLNSFGPAELKLAIKSALNKPDSDCGTS